MFQHLSLKSLHSHIRHCSLSIFAEMTGVRSQIVWKTDTLNFYTKRGVLLLFAMFSLSAPSHNLEHLLQTLKRRLRQHKLELQTCVIKRENCFCPKKYLFVNVFLIRICVQFNKYHTPSKEITRFVDSL